LLPAGLVNLNVGLVGGTTITLLINFLSRMQHSTKPC
jgi:hypothetical protein